MADKHPAEALADTIEQGRDVWAVRDAVAMLRSIPALEAERDALRAEVTRWSTTAAVIEAERNELRADAARYCGLRAAALAESPGMTASEADADVDANLADRST